MAEDKHPLLEAISHPGDSTPSGIPSLGWRRYLPVEKGVTLELKCGHCGHMSRAHFSSKTEVPADEPAAPVGPTPT